MRLVYVHPGGVLDPKAAEALAEYAKSWPGEIVAVTSNGDVRCEDVTVIATADAPSVVRELRPDVIGALHKPEYEYLLDHAPVVYTSEVSRRIRTELQRVQARSKADALRITLGQFRSELVYRRIAKRAAGLQCNGPGAWDAYGRLSARPISFHDHRIRAADLARAAERPVWEGQRPLRVAFSGRHTAIKGPSTVLRVAERLPDFEFVMLGDGALRTSLEREAPANVTFLGNLPFEEWKSYMRENVDVALLPHPQGDPSCTYFEALGSGVPVVGLRNSTWAPLVAEKAFGWAELDEMAIISRLQRLTPGQLDAARRVGLDFVMPFEDVARARVDHLIACATAR